MASASGWEWEVGYGGSPGAVSFGVVLGGALFWSAKGFVSDLLDLPCLGFLSFLGFAARLKILLVSFWLIVFERSAFT